MNRLIVVAIAALFVGATIFQSARARASAGADVRARLLTKGIIGLLVAIAIAIATPMLMNSMNHESPAGIVVLLVGWTVAGVLLIGGGATTLGAWRARAP